jgi:hypothetical protein
MKDAIESFDLSVAFGISFRVISCEFVDRFFCGQTETLVTYIRTE